MAGCAELQEIDDLDDDAILPRKIREREPELETKRKPLDPKKHEKVAPLVAAINDKIQKGPHNQSE